MRLEKRSAQCEDTTTTHDCYRFNEQRLNNLIFFREQIYYCRVFVRPLINQIPAEFPVLSRRQDLIAPLWMLQESPVQIVGRPVSARSHPGRPLAKSESELLTAWTS